MSRLDMADRGRLAERVDNDLKRGERETGLDFFDSDERFTITSYSPTIVRSLLKHNEARINWIYATGSAEPTGRVTNPSFLLDTDAVVEGVQATLPKGTLKIKGTVRRRNADNAIVSTPEDAQDAREAFTDGGRYILPGVGDRVVDREEGDELLVVELHEQTGADRYEIGLFGDTTVAEQNPHYDPAAPVVEAVYIDDVDETLDGWRSVEDVRDAVAFDAVTAYSFPADRLRGVDK